MENLSKEIEELVSLRNEYETKRKRLNDKVRELFNPEFERIKSKMPKEYTVAGFDIYDHGVSIPNPFFKEKIVNDEQLDNLNEIFNEEFLGIRKNMDSK